MPIRDSADRIVLWCGSNTDITEQRAATQRLRQKAHLIALSHEAVFSWDIDGTILTWNRGCEELYGYAQGEAIGSVSHDLLKSQHPLPRSEMLEILQTDGTWTGEILHFAKDGSKVWVDSRHEVLKVGGKLTVLESNRDITERRKSDEIRNLLVAELNHRVKNTLAVVQSVASQTARNSETIAQFIESFSGRLQSLSSGHNVLTDAHWCGADLRSLLKSELAVTVGPNSNVTLTGEDVFLPPQAALHFTLVLHELATNALKHGALSSPDGRIAVSWNRVPGGEPKLQFLWKESGGPTVVAPRRRGFGTGLIERSSKLPHTKAHLTFKPEGVECHMIANLVEDSTFEPVLFNPIRTEPKLASAPRAASPPVDIARGRSILLIEDEPLIAMEIQEMLTDAGFVALGPVTTVASALQAIERGTASGVILDGNLLGSCVEEILPCLKQAGLPFIVVTGSIRPSLPVAAGDVPFVMKPVRQRELLKALRVALDGKGCLEPLT